MKKQTLNPANSIKEVFPLYETCDLVVYKQQFNNHANSKYKNIILAYKPTSRIDWWLR
ncbi:MAG: hypothetical protein HXX16_13190 [Bacteroidales bacterium]|nr:hypothetical protein [Bacteroidales bacterium]